ncbi:MAG: ubiquinone biosynthesis protein UbiE [Lachnospiraceae bacterium]|jgi:hypothetical protein|nr:ubiquinone biosynthesis protein UbiE [Lachnospiraceae bacterium]MCI8994498.1 ubiquinone biosynthesis protein UbiE [Lachnospiraceae bacterium]
MDEIWEEMVSGYCRAYDQTRIVTCEYEKMPEGRRLQSTDCDYGNCIHSKSCRLMRQALELETGENP